MSKLKLNNSNNKLLFIGFNQNYQCFSCGLTTGFIIYNVNPFKKIVERNFNNCGIGCVEMLFKSNILALVGGGNNPKFPLNKVIIWDDHKGETIGQISLINDIDLVKMNIDKIIIITKYNIYIHSFDKLNFIDSILTKFNDYNLCEISNDSNIFIYPSLQIGYIKINRYNENKTHYIHCHDSDIKCMKLSHDNKLLATASVRGTIIRIWNVCNGNLIQELSRGLIKAEITSMCFSPKTSKWLVVSSTRETIHVYKIKNNINNINDTNIIENKINYIKNKLPKYLNLDSNFIQYNTILGNKIVSFNTNENIITVISECGIIYNIFFNEQKKDSRIVVNEFNI